MAEAPTDTDTVTFHPDQKVEITAISVKIPPYWTQDPMIWFAQVESQFATKGISHERTKYDHVVASLPQEVAMEVRDVIVSPPTANPYSKLKEKLLDRTTVSEQKRLHTLLTSIELGDRKPTQLLREMQRLLGQTDGKIDQALFKELFLQRLPQSIRLILTSSDTEMLLETQAKLADKMLEVSPATMINSVSHSEDQRHSQQNKETVSLHEEIRRLTETVAKLTTKVDELTQQQRHSRRDQDYNGSHKERSVSRSRNSSTRRVAFKDGLCYYHYKFGEQATKCQSPCNFHSSSKPLNEQASC